MAFILTKNQYNYINGDSKNIFYSMDFKSINKLFIKIFLLTFCLNLVNCESEKIYLNKFAVHLEKCDNNYANSIANKYGFVNSGQVFSLYIHI
jgi:hypothetical protein